MIVKKPLKRAASKDKFAELLRDLQNTRMP